MSNPRIPRLEYTRQVYKTRLDGLRAKVLHVLARHAPFLRLRLALYRGMGIKIGRRVTIGLDSYLDDQFAMATHIEDDCQLEARVGTVVHDDVGYDLRGGAFFKSGTVWGHVAEITIKQGAIIGARAVLLPGVIIGEQAIVRPGAVVTKDIPAKMVVTGALAQRVGIWQGDERVAGSLLPPNYMRREEYDARVRKGRLRRAYQGVLLYLARYTLPTRWRIALYRAMGVKIGREVYIGADTYFDDLYPELITLESNTGTSFRTTYTTHGVAYDVDGRLIQFVAPIHVQAGAKIGSNAVICPGVTIGQGAIIGSGSVVTDDIPKEAIAVGNPAHAIQNNPAEPGVDPRDRLAAIRRSLMKRN